MGLVMPSGLKSASAPNSIRPYLGYGLEELEALLAVANYFFCAAGGPAQEFSVAFCCRYNFFDCLLKQTGVAPRFQRSG
jgi:hypothetical protein